MSFYSFSLIWLVKYPWFKSTVLFKMLLKGRNTLNFVILLSPSLRSCSHSSLLCPLLRASYTHSVPTFLLPEEVGITSPPPVSHPPHSCKRY